MNPFSSGTLGLSTYNIDYASNYYYIAILGTSGIITTIYNPYTTYAVIIYLYFSLILNNYFTHNKYHQIQSIKHKYIWMLDI